MMTNNKLKPCPFCGGEGELALWHTSEWNVCCKQCKASCEQWSTKDGGIKAWNTRPSASVPSKEKILEVVMDSDFYKNIIQHKEAKKHIEEVRSFVNDLHALLTEVKNDDKQ